MCVRLSNKCRCLTLLALLGFVQTVVAVCVIVLSFIVFFNSSLGVILSPFWCGFMVSVKRCMYCCMVRALCIRAVCDMGHVHLQAPPPPPPSPPVYVYRTMHVISLRPMCYKHTAFPLASCHRSNRDRYTTIATGCCGKLRVCIHNSPLSHPSSARSQMYMLR